MSKSVYLGIDSGSVSTNIVVVNDTCEVLFTAYRYTRGDPLSAIRTCLVEAVAEVGSSVRGVGVTGSGRNMIGAVLGADVKRTEIIAHFRGVTLIRPKCRTIIEIGGQDSKITVIRGGMVADFNMNSICAAGTGAFLDSQARRLGLDVVEVGPLALSAERVAPISGRCTVFAESDMIHRQQQGYGQDEILAGLCQSLAKNYLNNCAKGKPIRDEVLFLGGVSNNTGIVEAFERELGRKVIVPRYNDVMGALGMAIFAKECGVETRFKGLEEVVDAVFRTRTFGCDMSDNRCDIVEIFENDRPIACWGGACERWSSEA